MAILMSDMAKRFKDLDLPILSRDSQEWSKTAGITPIKIQPGAEALAMNKKRQAIAKEFLHAEKAVPGRSYQDLLQSACFHKATETLE